MDEEVEDSGTIMMTTDDHLMGDFNRRFYGTDDIAPTLLWLEDIDDFPILEELSDQDKEW